jgi:formylglycine-generating enzyme required for sulfatase activity
MRNLVKMILVNNNLCVAETQVTQALFEEVMGWNPTRSVSRFSRPTPERCVKDVSWLDCVRFCNKLSELEGLEQAYLVDECSEQVWRVKGANGYRLPTEAEAKVMAGSKVGHLRLRNVLIDVNSQSPNSLGLKGVDGIWEWTSDDAEREDYKVVYSGFQTGKWGKSGANVVTFRVVRSR